MEPPFSTLPRELVTEVFSRVAVSSHTDIYNLKLCCKKFLNAANEDCILQHISLDHFPVDQWPKKVQVSRFLEKCLQNKNPEALFRKGVVDYFGGNDPERAVECLEEASRLGHTGASYALAIVLVLEGEELKKKGMKLLSEMKKLRMKKKTIKNCRERFKNIIENVWIKNGAILGQGRVNCCEIHQRGKSGWGDDYNIVCDCCACDQEIEAIFDAFHHQIAP